MEYKVYLPLNSDYFYPNYLLINFILYSIPFKSFSYMPVILNLNLYKY